MSNRLGIFAKHWSPGAVKTRLAATVGDEAAAELHLRFLQTLLVRLRSAGDDRVVYFTPAEQRQAFQTLVGPEWSIHPQTQGDLGNRMVAFFSECFRDRTERVVLIGSDSPQISIATITEAFARLEHVHVVLGPSDDGGYYLVGARLTPNATAPEIFDEIAWGGDSVLLDTIRKMQSRGISFAILPSGFDVDRSEDLRRLIHYLADSSDPALQTLHNEIRLLVPEFASAWG